MKEVELALLNNYEVSVLCCSFNNWSKNNNEEIKKRLQSKIHYFEVSGNRSPFLPWLFSSIYFFLSKFLLLFFPKNIFFLSLRSNKRSLLLLQEIKKIKEHIDLVVAHNPGSFYPAFKFAHHRQIPFGIDLEDFHPGETNDASQSKYAENLLQLIVPKAAYASASSALILKETHRIIGPLSCTVTVLNYFPENEFTFPTENKSDKLKLIWFSQNIARGRGLEEIIPIIEKNKNFELHLYGNVEEHFFKIWIEEKPNIFVHRSLEQKELHQSLYLYDVGLAIEKFYSNMNRDICLTNKILAYFQSGLYIVASDTSAQKQFINEHPEHGVMTMLDHNSLLETLESVWENKTSIRSQMVSRFVHAKKNSWEAESQKLMQVWEGILN